MDQTDPRLELVSSRKGREALNHLLCIARERGWHLRIQGKIGEGRGTFVPHVQFRRVEGERPCPYSLILNRVTPTFYVRRPTDRDALLAAFAGARPNTAGEVLIPVSEAAIARRIAERFLPVLPHVS